jgi:hypothetical protein
MNIFDKNTLAFIGLIAAVFKWLYETQKQRKWETNKYLFERYKEFEEKTSTEHVHRILDYNRVTSIKLEIEDKKFSGDLDDYLVMTSLRTHNQNGKFSELEYLIRCTFDDYFDNLTELILLSKCGLIDEKNLRLLLSYYINILNGNSRRKDPEYIEQIKNYLKFYNYSLVLEFINKKPHMFSHMGSLFKF